MLTVNFILNGDLLVVRHWFAAPPIGATVHVKRAGRALECVVTDQIWSGNERSCIIDVLIKEKGME